MSSNRRKEDDEEEGEEYGSISDEREGTS